LSTLTERARNHLAHLPPAAAVALLVLSGVALTSGEAAADAPRPAGPSCAPTAKACMDVDRHRAWLTDGAGHVTYGPVPAMGGKKGAETPTGTFRVQVKDRDFHSTEFNAPMPYSVFFYPGDAFHADNPRTTSNGCIHLGADAAERFFNGLHQGDQVQVVP
jgi:hypothetical protein